MPQPILKEVRADDLCPDWQQHGLCRRLPDITIDDFYYEGRFRDQSENMVRHEERLRSICAACPVRDACDQWADKNEQDGFWAGLTAVQRHRRKRTRKRQRSRERRAREMLTLEMT